MIDAVPRPLSATNTTLLRIGRTLGAFFGGLVVIAILVQVFFR